MNEDHKAKLAQGRADARTVKAYLEFLENNRPRRGRRRTEQSINVRLLAIETELESASPLARLNLFQEEMDLKEELEAMGQKVDGSELRAGFVEVAGRYANSKGLKRAAFSQMGIDTKTLREAGIK